jgi:hypothetical protein
VKYRVAALSKAEIKTENGPYKDVLGTFWATRGSRNREQGSEIKKTLIEVRGLSP